MIFGDDSHDAVLAPRGSLKRSNWLGRHPNARESIIALLVSLVVKSGLRSGSTSTAGETVCEGKVKNIR